MYLSSLLKESHKWGSWEKTQTFPFWPHSTNLLLSFSPREDNILGDKNKWTANDEVCKRF